MQASLATVYNVLNLFAEVGIVRGLAIEAELGPRKPMTGNVAAVARGRREAM